MDATIAPLATVVDYRGAKCPKCFRFNFRLKMMKLPTLIFWPVNLLWLSSALKSHSVLEIPVRTLLPSMSSLAKLWIHASPAAFGFPKPNDSYL